MTMVVDADPHPIACQVVNCTSNRKVLWTLCFFMLGLLAIGMADNKVATVSLLLTSLICPPS